MTAGLFLGDLGKWKLRGIVSSSWSLILYILRFPKTGPACGALSKFQPKAGICKMRGLQLIVHVY